MLQELLFQRTFQSWRELEQGFKLIGIGGLSGKLQTLYKVPDIKSLKSQLDKIVQNRNRIVHEADLVRHRRGGKARLHTISIGEVRKAITFLDDLVARLEKITEYAIRQHTPAAR